jgi:glycosyltransferase involved in cell wall biosynthesis
MRILTFNWHTPYLALLARLPHSFDVAPPSLVADGTLPNWHTAMRPVPENVRLIDDAAVETNAGQEGLYDLAICHNVKDLIRLKDIRIPKILVFHNKLTTEALMGGSLDKVEGYRADIAPLLNMATLVFISKSKRHDWGYPGEIVLPGIDVADYGGYVGAARRAVRVGNNIRVRDLMTGFSLQQEALAGLPNIVVGDNADLPESVGSKNWDDLKRVYRENRLLLNTNRAPYEDGYNLATLEAMATGMPTVNLANPSCPITDGVDGFAAEDVAGLRERIVRLLDDPALARRIGEAGRETVKRLFPIDRFVASWERIVEETVERFPNPPRRIFAPALLSPLPRFEKKTDGLNILLSYTSFPPSTGAYMHRAMEGRHDLVTVGPSMGEEVVRRWNLSTLKEKPRTHDIFDVDYTVEIGELIPQLPEGFVPDLFLWIETGIGRLPRRLDLLDCPKAAYLIDTHHFLDRHIDYAHHVDRVFLAQREYIPAFHAAGYRKVDWLPLGCDPEIHGKADLPKEYGVGFVGSLTDRRRVRLLLRLAERVPVTARRVFMREMTDHFCRSRIVFNNAIKNDLNMRVFEGLASGSMLLTDPAEGLTDFFTDREHLVIYDDADIADLARYYLDHEAEREAIAEAGRRLVLEKHTYRHRVDELIRIVTEGD